MVVADDRGTFHAVFGRHDTIFYATAKSEHSSLSEPVVVGVLPELVAGAKRGPQITTTDKSIVITAVNRTGNLFAFSLKRNTKNWSTAFKINDVADVAKEGFHAIAGTSGNTVYATWLDLRTDKRNKLVGATSHDGGLTWSENKLIYQSPSGTICECCKVSIAARQKQVYIQFRNWLDGSRDLYITQSTDAGKTFSPPQKLGQGTWKLNACPMDGGTVALDNFGQPVTVWRRENTLYLCKPQEQEVAVGTGRNVIMATGLSHQVIGWDEQNTIWVKVNNQLPVKIGTGQLPSIAVAKNVAFCVWETNGQINARKISL